MVKINKFSDVQNDIIGDGTYIWQYTIVLSGAVIGKNCNINSHCFIENDVIIGDNVTVKCGVYLWDGITIEDGVFIGPNVTFTNDLLPRSKKHPDTFLKTIIKQGASIGANSTIIGGITICEFALVGAGSVVTKDIGRNELWFGNPATRKGFICKCGNKLDINFKCLQCNKEYEYDGQKITGEKK